LAGKRANQLRNKTIQCLIIAAFYSVLYAVFFSPVIFSGGLLAPGDGIFYYLPNFFSKKVLWEPLVFAGFPVVADPQVMTWYPLAFFFSLLHSWNAFVISAYVFASCFAYGYVLMLTQSRLAGITSGIIYGMCGFMMAHLGHTSMLHAAVWMPLFLWSLENLRNNFTLRWFTVACFAISFSVFAGHPQILVYTIGLGTIYVFVRGISSAGIGIWKYYGLYSLILIFGIILATVQLLPTAELKDLGMRSKMNFDVFNECSLPAYQSFALFFPYLLGGIQGSMYPSYFGSCNVHELSGYIGILPILLAGIGFWAYRKKSIIWLWFCIALFAFLLTLGNATPFAQVMYYIPAYNKFRVPARHFIEMALAVSVLAGFGMAAIQNKLATRRLILGTILAGAVTMLSVFVAILVASERLNAYAFQNGVRKIALLPWANPAIGLPLILLLAGCAVIYLFSKQAQSRFRQVLLLSILIIDLGSFGWFMQWKYGSPNKEMLAPSAMAERYAGLLNATNQRMLITPGAIGDFSGLKPNISRLWGIPSANGYNPLILSRVRELLSMEPAGVVSGFWFSEFDRSFDIMAIRYVFLPQDEVKTPKYLEKNGFTWSVNDTPLHMGAGCNVLHSDSLSFHLPVPVNATAIGIVSAMACSADVADDAEVVHMKLTDVYGNSQITSLRAGKDTSEWAYDCEDVLPLMKHQRATVFESWPNMRESSKPCEGHKYVSVVPLNRMEQINSVELLWTGRSGTIRINKISLLDKQSDSSYPLFALSSSLADSTRWRHVEDVEGLSVFENLRAMPRAWLVKDVVSVKPDEVLYAIKASRLPDGRAFNPARTALIEEPLSFKGTEAGVAAARISHIDKTSMEILTDAESQSFLVLSDVYYPGWKAAVDGKWTHIFQTDYVLRGVVVPPGKHVVRFEFRPGSFYLGAGISAVSLFLLFSLSLIVMIKRRKRSI
jgi:hypothetical protein